MFLNILKNLHCWTALIPYNGFHDNWKSCDDVSLLDDDRYLVACYVLWRKWPLQYEALGQYKDVRNACDYFKKLYEKEIKQGKLVLKEPNFMLEWQFFHHCVRDKIEIYNDNIVSVYLRSTRSKKENILRIQLRLLKNGSKSVRVRRN